MRITGFRKLFALLPLILAPIFICPLPATANEAQFHVLSAGINIGWAEATLLLYREDRIVTSRVSEYLSNAAEHIRTAESLFQEPYRSERAKAGRSKRLIDRIRVYPERSRRMPRIHRIAFVKNLWSTYRQGFQTTYDSIQGFHYQPNCDMKFLDTGYHFGRAHIAAGVQDSRARTYQNGALSGMRSAINSGLQIALDGMNREKVPIGIKKVCCAFGSKREWRSLPNFKRNSPFDLFTRNVSTLQRIARSANLAPGACGGTGDRDRGDHEGRKHDCKKILADLKKEMKVSENKVNYLLSQMEGADNNTANNLGRQIMSHYQRWQALLHMHGKNCPKVKSHINGIIARFKARFGVIFRRAWNNL